jgi:hypothetical protein
MTIRWPWQRRLDAKREREARTAERRQAQVVRERMLFLLDPDTLCECGHPLDAHPKKIYPYSGSISRYCGATVTRRHEHGDDVWPCGCREFREAALAA